MTLNEKGEQNRGLKEGKIINRIISYLGGGNKEYRGYIQICFASLFFGFLPIAAKWAYASGVSVLTLLHYRFAIAAAFLWMFLFAFERNRGKVELEILIVLALLGAAGYGIPAFLFFSSLKRIPAGIAGIILYSYPAFVIFFSRFLYGERINFYKIAALFLVVLGMIFVLEVRRFRLDLLGILMAFGASVIFSLYLCGGQKIVQRVKPQLMSTYVMSFAALFFLVIQSLDKGLVTDEVSVPGQWAIILLIAVVCTSFPVLLQLSALEKIGGVRTSLISTLEPLWVIFFDFLFFGILLTLQQLIGGLIVIGGIMVIGLFDQERALAAKKLKEVAV
jgi:drug/metabolite transporter (DMT)-like permease